MSFLKPGAAFLLCWGSFAAFGQANRIQDRNSIGWYVYEGDHQLSKRWTLHTEYQWRRTEFLTKPQQQLARLGAAYQLLPRLSVAAGYTNLITQPYGDFPTADTGVPFPSTAVTRMSSSATPWAMSD
ncbi:DUF2490 domain-containing protein [Hymenobacter cellulosivorans]|uniref:DUF2490 domain-containing protein n=1 Tax=Hymenobacter cellulosivorans TaxID=2932249 RepID=UPI0021D45E38|nr:DUF2490 domain-containing protein [Hymenobacter cellulosivorans]